ncbi:MAG: hypothetical protein KC415_09320 [Anaerolineales bacterium]|nr:hypothetical protein [Anaerolineales bacterium]
MMTDNGYDLLDQFDTAPYEKRVQLFRTALANGRLDEDTAFEMLSDLYDDTAVHDARSLFDEWVTALRTQAPELYAGIAGYLLEWQITHALVDGRTAELPALSQQLAQQAASFPNEVVVTGEKLAYYGQLDTLAKMMSTAWPHIQNADFDEWAVEEFAVQGMNYAILNYVATAVSPDPTDPHLLALLDPFAEIEADTLTEYLAQVTGQTNRSWQPSDFAVPPQSSNAVEIPDEVDANLTQLLREFMHAVHSEKSLPLSRAALAYWPLNEYLLSRLEESARAYQPRRKKAGRFERKTYGLSPLCPTTISLAQFLSNMLELVAPQHYPAAAILSVLPTWLRFLHNRGLITAEQQAQTELGLQELLPELREFWGDMPTDPALVACVME